MTGSLERSTSESEPSPENADEPTVAWEMPVKEIAGIRDPGTKAFGTAILALATWVSFHFDLDHKPLIMSGAIALNVVISSYGPYAGTFFLRALNQQIAERQLRKLEGLRKQFPNDPDIEAKVAMGRKIIADGWLTRLQHAASKNGPSKSARKK